MLERLRPVAGREGPLAVGAVCLATFAVLVQLRMTQWSLGPRFIVVAVISGLILVVGWPRARRAAPVRFESVLVLAGLLVLILALQLLAEVFGANRPPGSGGDFWTFGGETVVAGLAARRANSSGCTLIAGIAAAISLLALIAWVFHPHGLGTFRAIMLLEAVALAAGAAYLHSFHRRHAVQLVNVAGLVTLLLAFTFLAAALVSTVESRFALPAAPGLGAPGFGWKLYLLIVAAGLLTYGALQREPSPGILGILVLFSFASVVGLPPGDRGSLVGWPLFLLIVGAAAVAYGFWGGLPGVRMTFQVSRRPSADPAEAPTQAGPPPRQAGPPPPPAVPDQPGPPGPPEDE